MIPFSSSSIRNQPAFNLTYEHAGCLLATEASFGSDDFEYTYLIPLASREFTSAGFTEFVDGMILLGYDFAYAFIFSDDFFCHKFHILLILLCRRKNIGSFGDNFVAWSPPN